MRILDHIEQTLERTPSLPFEVVFKGERAMISYPEGGFTEMMESIEGILVMKHCVKSSGFKMSTKGIGEGVKLNYCIAGRLEVSMNDGRSFYLGPGELSVKTSTASEFSFPCGFYQGVEIFIHPSCLNTPPRLFVEAGIDLAAVVARLSTPEMRSWTKRSDDATERAFLTIFEPRRFAEDASARIGIAQLLLKLAEDGAPARDFDSTILTKRQVDLAKEAERILAGDLSKRKSIESIAAELGVKPTALKTYFKGVYGAPISEYLHKKRMRTAALLLETEDDSVAAIAHSVGFANAGKFSEAFKRAYGTTPLKYRLLFSESSRQGE